MASQPVSTAFNEHGVVPDVIRSLSGAQLLTLVYNGIEVSPGEKVARSATVSKPQIQFKGAEAGKEYVVIMVDPDLFKTNDPTGQVRHWLQTLTFNTPTPTYHPEITSYLAPSPGPGTGYHRYTFVLCQPKSGAAGGIPADLAEGYTTGNRPDEDLKDRMGFYVDKYIQDKGLEIVAANFMLVGSDVKSAVDNLTLGAQALADKALGK